MKNATKRKVLATVTRKEILRLNLFPKPMEKLSLFLKVILRPIQSMIWLTGDGLQRHAGTVSLCMKFFGKNKTVPIQ